MVDLKILRPVQSCPCGSNEFAPAFEYTAPPPGEVRFRFTSDTEYRRQILRCGRCGHFVSVHSMNAGDLYSGEYVTATYGEGGLGAAFERIVALAPGQSDNAGRVRRILDFTRSHFGGSDEASTRRSVLDVGSGLCVFLHAMKAAGWSCTALDPDPRAAQHAREHVAVDAVWGDLLSVEGLGCFDVMTFNKVLEHVEDPVAMLAMGSRHLDRAGFVYVEVPDGEHAFADGPEREEFFIDHLHVFSAASLSRLAERSGFAVRRIEALREPSGKYTLFAFLTLQNEVHG